MRRRLRFKTLVLISQMLLVALALTIFLQLYRMAVDGSMYFIENNNLTLYLVIFSTLFITIFAICILIVQIREMGERRGTDRHAGSQSNQLPMTDPHSLSRDEIDSKKK